MKKLTLEKESWLFIILTVLCLTVLIAFVDLNPHVDYDVFFASDDPSYQADIDISHLFPRGDSQILISVAGDIYSHQYQQKIKSFGDMLHHIEHISDVKSIMHGPRTVEHAAESPFWGRLLISGQKNLSNMLVIFDSTMTLDRLPVIIPKIESLKKIFETDDFSIRISGFPYIVELIRRHLNHDLRIFTGLAFIIFGIVAVVVFHSWGIFLGMVISCLTAASLTLMTNYLLGVKIGILTANLTTIIFVITLSDIVFLTFNWKQLCTGLERRKAVSEAIRITLPASFWSMVTTFLGFLSLLAVPAKPIRELGLAGIVGTLIAFCVTYSIFPAFLRLQTPPPLDNDNKTESFYRRSFAYFEKRHWIVYAIVFGIILTTVTSLRKLNIDPSLISFFSPKSPITQGLKYIDTHGGSNPLILVVKNPNKEPLDTPDSIKKLWKLQEELEKQPDVGTVLSIAPLLAETRNTVPFASLLSNRQLLNLMSSHRFGEVSRSFITNDHQYALFLMRMKEDGRKEHRVVIIEQIKQIVKRDGFALHLVGGVYSLQGHLSQYVAKSLIYGLGQLILIFLVIAFVISFSFRIAAAMAFSIGVVCLCALGPIGALRLPLDLITAPATNIAISMGINAMIHMNNAYKRLYKQNPKMENMWLIVRQRFWSPILTSMFIVSCGFAIFFMSSFPPTQRFGGSVVFGTIMAAASALFIFPALATKKSFPQPKLPTEKTNRFNKIFSDN